MADGQSQYIQLPDGSYGEFPSDMKDEEIRAAIDKQFPPSRVEGVGRFAASAPRALRQMAGEAGEAVRSKYREYATPAPPGQEKPFYERAGRALWENVGKPLFGEGVLAGGTGEAGGIAGGGYRPEDPASPLVLAAGEAAMPIVGRAAEKYAPTFTGAAKGLISRFGRAAEAEAPRPLTPREEQMPTVRTPPIGSSEAELDAATRRAGLGEKFGDLSHEDQMRVMRTYGGEAEPPIERRRPGGPGPPTAERRAAPTPVPRVTMAQTQVRPLPPGASERDVQFHRLFGPEYQEAGDLAEWETGSREGKPRPPLTGERLRDVAGIVEGAFNEPRPAGPPAYTLGEAMGVRVAKAPGLADVYIPNRMSEAEIPGFVAQQHALERQMKPGLPGQLPTTTPPNAPPAPRPAAPEPSGREVTISPESSMPQTRVPRSGRYPPAPPAPTTIGGGATMGQLPTEQELAEEARRGQMPKVTPPKEVP